MKARTGMFGLLSTAALVCVAFSTPLRCQSSITLQCFYDDLGQLTKVIDPSGNVTTYTYDSVGNILQVSSSAVSPGALAIFNFNPQQGNVGANVTIQGQNFSTNPASDTVTFNGTPATVVTATSTTLVATVPLGATTGTISITVGGATAQGASFSLLPAFVILPANPSLPLGNTVQLTAAETFSDGTFKDDTATSTWNSSFPAIVTVSDAQGSAGLATTVAAGTTSITATLGAMSASTILTVNPPAAVSLTVAPSNPSVTPGTVVHFSATSTLTDGTIQDETYAVSWASSNSAVATISNLTAGLATTLTNGTTTISATLGSITSSTTLTVTQASEAMPRFALLSNSDGTISIFAVDANSGQLRATGYATLGPNVNYQGSYSATDPSGAFVYVLYNSPPNVLGFSIDPSRGALTPIPGSPFGSQATAVAVSTKGNVVLVTASGLNLNTVTAYTIGQGGVLTPAPGGASSTGATPISVAADPSGKFVYVGNRDGLSISAFVLDPTTGALAGVSGSPFAAPQCSFNQMTTDPSGRFLYLPSGSGVCAFTIDSTSGALTKVNGSPFAAGALPVWVTAEPSGKFLYAVNQFSNNVSAFSINSTTGALTSVSQPPISVGLSPDSMTVDPSGKFAYVVNGGSHNITSFTLDTTSGALTPDATYRSRGQGGSIVISKSSAPLTFKPKFAYVVNSGANTISASTIDAATGALSSVPNSPFAVGPAPTSATSDPTGKFLYVAYSNSGTVSEYTIDSSAGSITQVGSPFPAGSGPASVTVEPSDRFAYVPNQGSNNVSAYGIASTTGALNQLANSPFSAHNGPVWTTTEPLGSFAYVANQSSNDVSGFQIDQVAGALLQIPNSPFAAGNGPLSIASDPTGNWVYVANSGSNSVSAYSINNAPFLGILSQIGSPLAAGTSPSSLTVDVSGRFLYVANAGSNNVSAYSINPSTGGLAALPISPVAAGTKPSGVTVDFSGKFLYVTNSGDSTVSVFAIDPASGSLNPAGSFPTGSNPNSITTTGVIQ